MNQREIKFRCWNPEDQIMLSMQDVYGNGIYLSLDGHIKRFIQGMDIDRDMWRGKLILMQFTGLKDKNGHPIYEGDILQIPDYKEPEFFRMVVKWEADRALYNINVDALHLIEIIGNIYENPELLISDDVLKAAKEVF